VERVCATIPGGSFLLTSDPVQHQLSLIRAITVMPTQVSIHDLWRYERQRTYAGGSGSQGLDRVGFASHSKKEQPMSDQSSIHPATTVAETADFWCHLN